MERIIGAVHQRFQILSATGVLPKELFKKKTNRKFLLDSVVHVCCALNKLRVQVSIIFRCTSDVTMSCDSHPNIPKLIASMVVAYVPCMWIVG